MMWTKLEIGLSIVVFLLMSVVNSAFGPYFPFDDRHRIPHACPSGGYSKIPCRPDIRFNDCAPGFECVKRSYLQTIDDAFFGVCCPSLRVCPKGSLQGPFCNYGSKCPKGYLCQNGVCCHAGSACPTGSTESGKCSFSFLCKPGNICTNGVCCSVPNQPLCPSNHFPLEGVQCNTDTHCPGKSHCFNYKCCHPEKPKPPIVLTIIPPPTPPVVLLKTPKLPVLTDPPIEIPSTHPPTEVPPTLPPTFPPFVPLIPVRRKPVTRPPIVLTPRPELLPAKKASTRPPTKRPPTDPPAIEEPPFVPLIPVKRRPATRPPIVLTPKPEIVPLRVPKPTCPKGLQRVPGLTCDDLLGCPGTSQCLSGICCSGVEITQCPQNYSLVPNVNCRLRQYCPGESLCMNGLCCLPPQLTTPECPRDSVHVPEQSCHQGTCSGSNVCISGACCSFRGSRVKETALPPLCPVGYFSVGGISCKTHINCPGESICSGGHCCEILHDHTKAPSTREFFIPPTVKPTQAPVYHETTPILQNPKTITYHPTPFNTVKPRPPTFISIHTTPKHTVPPKIFEPIPIPASFRPPTFRTKLTVIPTTSTTVKPLPPKLEFVSLFPTFPPFQPITLIQTEQPMLNFTLPPAVPFVPTTFMLPTVPVHLPTLPQTLPPIVVPTQRNGGATLPPYEVVVTPDFRFPVTPPRTPSPPLQPIPTHPILLPVAPSTLPPPLPIAPVTIPPTFPPTAPSNMPPINFPTFPLIVPTIFPVVTANVTTGVTLPPIVATTPPVPLVLSTMKPILTSPLTFPPFKPLFTIPPLIPSIKPPTTKLPVATQKFLPSIPPTFSFIPSLPATPHPTTPSTVFYKTTKGYIPPRITARTTITQPPVYKTDPPIIPTDSPPKLIAVPVGTIPPTLPPPTTPRSVTVTNVPVPTTVNYSQTPPPIKPPLTLRPYPATFTPFNITVPPYPFPPGAGISTNFPWWDVTTTRKFIPNTTTVAPPIRITTIIPLQPIRTTQSVYSLTQTSPRSAISTFVPMVNTTPSYTFQPVKSSPSNVNTTVIPLHNLTTQVYFKPSTNPSNIIPNVSMSAFTTSQAIRHISTLVNINHRINSSPGRSVHRTTTALISTSANLFTSSSSSTTIRNPIVTSAQPPLQTTIPYRTPPVQTTTPKRTPPVKATTPKRTQPVQATTPKRTPPVQATTPKRTPPVKATTPKRKPSTPRSTPPVQTTTPKRTPPVQTSTPIRTSPIETTTPKRTPPIQTTTPKRTPPIQTSTLRGTPPVQTSTTPFVGTTDFIAHECPPGNISIPGLSCNQIYKCPAGSQCMSGICCLPYNSVLVPACPVDFLSRNPCPEPRELDQCTIDMDCGPFMICCLTSCDRRVCKPIVSPKDTIPRK